MGTGVNSAFEPLTPEDPRKIAEYRLLARLGEGGMGTVYLSHTRGGQPVALKLIRREYGGDASFRRRFGQEVAAARRVRGYHLVPVVDYDTTGEQPWLASEFVPGVALDDALAEYGPLPLTAVFQLVGCAAQALSAIHTAGVVHRDIKPSNIMLATSGPYVIDFGIARAAGTPQLTTTGRIGTPQYMSPEHTLGQAVGPASDVFSLGLVAAVAATGRHPYGEGGAITLATQIANTTDRPPDLSGYPAPLRTLLERCLTASPDERITPAEVAEVCEGSAGRALGDVDGWLPKPLTDAIAHRATEVPGPPPPPPSPPPVTRTVTRTEPAPSGSLAEAPTVSAPSTTAAGAVPNGNPPPTRPAARGVSKRTVRAVVAVGVLALGLLLLGPTLVDWLGPDDSKAEPSSSAQPSAGDGKDSQDQGKAGASDSPTPESTKPRYVPVIKEQPFELRAPDYNEVVADLDAPQVVPGGDYNKRELVVTTAASPEGWHFSRPTGITTTKTPEACLRSTQANALTEKLAFEDFEETIPVGTLLCTETSDGNLAMVEITALAPARTNFGGLDVSTRLTVWEQR